MMKASVCGVTFSLIVLACVSLAIAETQGVSFFDTVRTFEQIERVKLFTRNYRQKKSNILSEGLNVELSAFGKDFAFDLEINEDLFAKDAVVRIFTDEGVEETKPFIVSYKGKLSEDRNVRFTVHDFENGIVSGFFRHDGDVYYVEPVYEQHVPEQHKRSILASTKMLVYRASDFIALSEGSEESIAASKRQLLTANQLKQPPLAPSKVQGCIGTLRQLTVAFAADHGFTTDRGGSSGALTTIQSIMSTTTAVYESTVAVRLTIGTTEIMTSANSAPAGGSVNWNFAKPNCPQIQTLLDRFSSYVKSRKSGDPAGLWHLMTVCYASGTGAIGVAYIGVLCDPNRRTGVSSFTGQYPWIVVAHEFGHNFGAPHTWQGNNVQDSSPSNEGLMSYKGNAAAFTRNSQTAMCKHIGTTKASCFSTTTCTSSCPVTGKPCGEVCGQSCGTCNGANGEVCDTATNLCKQQCTPNCGAAQCGSNGCGGSCGTCPDGSTCDSSRTCVSTPDIAATVTTKLNAERSRVGSRSLTFSVALQNLAANAGCSYDVPPAIQNPGYGNTILLCAGCTVGAYIDYIINTLGKGWSCASTSNTIYTQAIWDKTTEVGCALIKNCAHPIGGQPTDIFRCVWNPAGNQLGQKPVPNCACQPTTSCIAQGRTCGTLWNGCENVNCGSCSTSAPCNANGQCECTPKTSCSGLCGLVSDGCGGVLTCPACQPQTSGPTSCIPRTADQACINFNCGTRPDGCGGTVSCGACNSENPVCQNNVCVGCPSQCPPSARCDNNTLSCVCRPGFKGDGITCTPTTPVPPGAPVSGSLDWKPLYDSNPSAWRLNNDQIWHEPAGKTPGANIHNIARWDESLQFTSETSVTFAVWAYKFSDVSATAGLGLRVLDADNMLYAYWTQTTINIRWLFNQPGYKVENRDIVALSLNSNSFWNANSWKELKVTINGNKYTFETGPNNLVTADITLPDTPALPGAGPFSLVASGPIRFDNVSLATISKVRLRLYGCLTAAEFKERAARLLNIPISSIIAVVSDQQGCAFGNKKRQGSANTLVTYEVEFKGTTDSLSSASNLEGLVEFGDPALAENDLAIVETSSIQAASPVASVAAEVSAVAIGGAALGAGAIAGIVIGSVAGVAVIGAAAAGDLTPLITMQTNHIRNGNCSQKRKQSKDDNKSQLASANPLYSPESNPPQTKEDSSIKKGVNVFELDPGKVTSITARAPPREST